MAYIRRVDGNIVEYSRHSAVGDISELIAEDSAELTAFLNKRLTVSRSEFFDSLTSTERTAIRASGNDNIQDWWDRLQFSDTVALSDPVFLEGLQLLVTANIINETRKAELSR